MSEKPYVGGQAVIEGVMMRSPKCLAIAVRKKDGTIVVREDAWVSLWEKLGFLRWPIFRGAIVLLESVYNGIQALTFAQEQALEDEKEDDAEEQTAERSKWDTVLTISVSFLIAIALFLALPHALAWGAGLALGNETTDVRSFAFHALDGLFKLGIFVGYIWAISRIPEIRRVFQYHGAEHKAVNAYENGLELTVDNTRPLTTFHARCGTSFILFVLVLSIFMFAGVLPMIPPVSENSALNHLAMVAIKVPLMIPLAGVAYEINRFAARHPTQFWVQAIVAPGRLMQKLTTREPDDDQLEIALSAMRAALRREHAYRGSMESKKLLRDPRSISSYASYDELAEAIQPTS